MTDPSAASRPRASVACQRCRVRKVKCDAQSFAAGQSCSPCRRVGEQCRLDPALDGRRSISHKHVEELQQRIQQLEARTRHDGDRTDAPLNVANQGSGISRPNSMQRSQSPSASATQPNANQGSRSPTPLQQRRQSQSSRATARRNTRDQVVEDLSGFFGTTSHPHVGTPLDQPNLTDQSDTIDIGIHTGSVHLENHLIHSFFNYQTLWVDVVNKDIFLAHRARGVPSQWYSTLLENAVLACATRLATSNAVRALGHEYLQLAKSVILCNLSEPTPAALQALLLLSEYEVTYGNDRIGWMFCGMACRMVSDLGLHEIGSLPDNSHNEQVETTQESDLAYALLAACIVYEGVWTLYLGRPSSIPKSIMDIAAERCKAKLPSDSPLLNAWLGLCVPMAEVSQILNSPITAHHSASFSLPKLMAQIQVWYDTLSPNLTYDERNLTNLDMSGYGLHTQYCKVQILFKRAFELSPNPQKRKLWQASENTAQGSTAQSAGREIYYYSLRIARLVVTYREVFGVDKIPSIMLDNAVVAATGLIKYFNQKPSPSGHEQRDLDWIRLLIRTLESVQPHFPITRRMLETLRRVNEGDPLSALFNTTGMQKPGQASISSESNPNGSSSKVPTPAMQAEQPAEELDISMWTTDSGEDASNGGFWASIDDMFTGVPFTMSPAHEADRMAGERMSPLMSSM